MTTGNGEHVGALMCSDCAESLRLLDEQVDPEAAEQAGLAAGVSVEYFDQCGGCDRESFPVTVDDTGAWVDCHPCQMRWAVVIPEDLTVLVDGQQYTLKLWRPASRLRRLSWYLRRLVRRLSP